MDCGIVVVVMGIILSIIGNFIEHCSKGIIGKNWSIIGRGLGHGGYDRTE